MGNANTTSAPNAGAGAGSTPQACPVDHAAPKTGACPVDHKQTSGEQAKYKNPKQYNVYSQEINPSNNMPSKAAQKMAPGQTQPLSTERVQSNIPKAGTDSTWLYPSPQMFFNALTRKRKRDDDVQEEDMATVVAVHNNMNERAWLALEKWERCHEGECDDPRLLRFKGRPFDLSPKARMKTWLGYPEPFDRHDWIVDRCGKEVRYVIDYYYNEAVADQDETPALRDVDRIKSIDMDVRPAVDSIGSFFDRLRMFPSRAMEAWNKPKPVDNTPMVHTPPPTVSMALRGAAPRSNASAAPKPTPEEELQERVHNSCSKYLQELEMAQSEAARSQASMGLMLCMGKHLCVDETKAFRATLQHADPSEEATQAAYQAVVGCLSTKRDFFASLEARSKAQ